MTVIDAHVHFWDPQRLSYPWLAGTELDRPYRPEHLAAELGELPDLVVVQAECAPEQARAELAWMRAAAEQYPSILGMVAYAPLETGAAVAGLVAEMAEDPFVVGVRRNIQGEPAGFATSDTFRYGVRLVGDFGLTFDACVQHHQLAELGELVEDCPQTMVVLDHLGKPPVGAGGDAHTEWRGDLERLAAMPNVVCKLSGLVTEADPATWTPAQLGRYLYDALELFGPDRCMFGSDWPVVNLAGGYQRWRNVLLATMREHPASARECVLGTVAETVYRLGHRAR